MMGLAHLALLAASGMFDRRPGEQVIMVGDFNRGAPLVPAVPMETAIPPGVRVEDGPSSANRVPAHRQLGYTDAEMAAHRARDAAAKAKRDRKNAKRAKQAGR